MRRLLYFMNVSWGWIKQRPHFIAEELSQRYEVTLFSVVGYRRSSREPNPMPNTLHARQLWRLPFVGRSRLLLRATEWTLGLQAWPNIRCDDIVWIAHPFTYRYLKRYLGPGNPIVYDCMDDLLEFPAVANSEEKRRELRSAEEALCRASSVIIASSDHLKNTLLSRYSLDVARVAVVNNGLNTDIKTGAAIPESVEKAFRSETKKFVYVGTISEWFDFNLVLDSLRHDERVEYLLFGPALTRVPQHNRIKHLGSVPHGAVYDVMRMADALVMPFSVNELIRAVDPVKVYEYIYAGKPALVVRYPETEKFEPYVHLYRDVGEYLKICRAICDGQAPRNTALPVEVQGFLQRSTWRARSGSIAALLDTLP